MSSEDVWGGFSDEDFLAVDGIDHRSNHQSSNTTTSGISSTSCSPKVEHVSEDANLNGVKQLPKKRSSEIKLDERTTITVSTVPFALPSSSFAAIKKKRPNDDIPLYRYRYGRLWVTHLVQQFWCEQQMHFGFDPPLELLDVEIKEPPQVTVGSSIHLARELEIHDVVEVKVVSREDRFAVKLSNLLSAVQSLIVHGTTVHREIPVFGAPFGMGVFVIGMIDEMRCDQETLNLAIVELKTRKSNCMPTSSQKMTHRLQLMLYKRLFDEMVNGCLTKEIISKHMKLNMTKVLGKGVLEHLQDRRVNTLSKLMDTLLKLLQAVPFISDLFLEYVYQEDGSVIGNIPVVYDESWVKSKLIRAFSYWKGDRQAVGVDIEDSWKCSYCPYSVACEWRAKLEQQMEKLAIETTKVETSSCERGEEEEEEKEGKANKMNSPLADNRDVESDQTADPQVSAQTG